MKLMKSLFLMFLCAAALVPVFAGGQQDGDGTATLTVWLNGEPGTVNGYSRIMEEFAAQHENVDVEVVFVGSDLFNPALVPALSSGEGPDVFMFGTGPGQPAAIIEGGLVLDLTAYMTSYGWEKIIPEAVMNYTSSEGILWSVGDQVETTMMFYNKKIFNDLGLSVPETLEDFYSVCDALIAAGYKTPIGLGGADRWPISHWQSMVFGRFGGPAGVDKVMFGDGRWDEKAFVQAAAFLQGLSQKGYFGSNPNAQGYGEVMDSFWAGDVPMTYTGPWVINDAVTKLGEKVRDFSVFQLPPLGKGQKIYPTESIGSGWYIGAGTKYPDLSAELLNYMLLTDSSRALLLESGTSWPIGPVEEVLKTIDLPLLREQMSNLTDRYRGNGTVHAFLDTVQPTATTEATYNGLQGLLSAEISPETFCMAIQKQWEEDKAEGLILKPGGVRH